MFTHKGNQALNIYFSLKLGSSFEVRHYQYRQLDAERVVFHCAQKYPASQDAKGALVARHPDRSAHIRTPPRNPRQDQDSPADQDGRPRAQAA